MQHISEIINDYKITLFLLTYDKYKYRIKEYENKIEVRKSYSNEEFVRQNSRMIHKHNHTHNKLIHNSTHLSPEFSTRLANSKGQALCVNSVQSTLDISTLFPTYPLLSLLQPNNTTTQPHNNNNITKEVKKVSCPSPPRKHGLQQQTSNHSKRVLRIPASGDHQSRLRQSVSEPPNPYKKLTLGQNLANSKGHNSTVKQSPNSRTRRAMRDYIDANVSKFTHFTTLTFRTHVNTFDGAKGFFQDWIDAQKRAKRITHYIGTWELTKKGRVHFHLLTDAEPAYPRDPLNWRHGFVYSARIYRPEGLANYMTKYLSKGFDSSRPYTRKLLKSQTLEKPKIKIVNADFLNSLDLIYKTSYYDFINQKNVDIFDKGENYE